MAEGSKKSESSSSASQSGNVFAPVNNSIGQPPKSDTMLIVVVLGVALVAGFAIYKVTKKRS